MNKDQIEGAGKVVAGTLKNVAGKLTGDARLRAEGGVEKMVGEVQGKVGDAKAELDHEVAAAKTKTKTHPKSV